MTVLTPGFIVLAYLPPILHTAGRWTVIATIAYGAGQVTGTTVVPRLIMRRGARSALRWGALGVILATALLMITRTIHPAAAATAAALGLAVGLTVVPQQHRLFASVPRLAPVAVGLNGSAIYLASALGATLGGAVLALADRTAVVLVAVAVGLLALVIVSVARVDR